jgi:hypothetical protein
MTTPQLDDEGAKTSFHSLATELLIAGHCTPVSTSKASAALREKRMLQGDETKY